MFEKILVAIDGSDESLKALDTATELARLCNSQVVVAHALLRGTDTGTILSIADKLGCKKEISDEIEKMDIEPVIPASPQPLAMTEASLIPESLLRSLASSILDYSEQRLTSQNVNSTTSILDAPPDTALLELAKQEGVDLIVIGRRGFGQLKSIVLGSVSQKVLQNAECPCLVIRK